MSAPVFLKRVGRCVLGNLSIRLEFMIALSLGACGVAEFSVESPIDEARHELEAIHSQSPDWRTSRMFFRSESDSISREEAFEIAGECAPLDFVLDESQSAVREREIVRVFLVCRATEHWVIYQRYLSADLREGYNSMIVCEAGDCDDYPERHFSLG